MQVKNNPVGRLYDILESARRANQKKSVREAWTLAFTGEPQTDNSTFVELLAGLTALVSEAKRAVSTIEGVDTKLYLLPFEQIENALGHMNLEAEWLNVQGQLTDAVMMGLRFGADHLSRRSEFSDIAPADLTELQKQLDDLSAAILVASIPAELKSVLVRCLESARMSLIAFRIRGIDGLQEELERLVGAVVMRKNQVEASRANASENPVWQKLFLWVERAQKLITTAKTATTTGIEAAEAIQSLPYPFN